MKKTVLSIVCMLSLVVAVVVFPASMFAAEADTEQFTTYAAPAKDVTHLVDVSGIDVLLDRGNGYDYIIKDGEKVPGTPNPNVGNGIRLQYKWNITKESLSQINSGDFFCFQLPNEYFCFTDLLQEYSLLDQYGQEVGVFIIKDNQIIITLNEYAVSQVALNDGTAAATGKVVKSGNNIIIEDESGITLPPIDIPDPGNGSVAEYPFESPGIISKIGGQASGSNEVYWNIFVNYDNQRERFDTGSCTTLKDAFLVDKLEYPQTYFSLKIKSILYTAKSDGLMSKNVFAYADVLDQFEVVEPTNET